MAFDSDTVSAIRASRRRPRPTQFDYLHLRYLARRLARVLPDVVPAGGEVLDVWCGSRPYEDLLPAGARVVGLDVPENPYGAADVVSDEILPFESGTFDAVLCIEAFQWMPDPARAVAEFARVLRPGGAAVVSLPFAFEYERPFEHRFTESQLRGLFEGWGDVSVSEDGGRAVSWAVLTGSFLESVGGRAHFLRPLAAAGCAAVNGLGLLLAGIEARTAASDAAYPMNLTLTARRPPGG
jgi:SAM-dependent methyltransferase